MSLLLFCMAFLCGQACIYASTKGQERQDLTRLSNPGLTINTKGLDIPEDAPFSRAARSEIRKFLLQGGNKTTPQSQVTQPGSALGRSIRLATQQIEKETPAAHS